MKIIFFAHPLFLTSQSMPRFVSMLSEGMESRGHEVEIWRPRALFSKLKIKSLKKWLGYVDQYIVFPNTVKRGLKAHDQDVLYVVTDHALGPYVPLVVNKPHVIHCHDFLAQAAALGKIVAPKTSFTGRQYQAFIQRGYSKGANFISVSKKTQSDLERHLNHKPVLSRVIYNGVNDFFKLSSISEARKCLSQELNIDFALGYILHVGGNQWYKNRVGVITIYNKWRELYQIQLPLILIGHQATALLLGAYNNSPFKDDIYLISTATDEMVRNAYSGASVFLFPSLAEGFGWPIAEAMASGTLVVTTNEAPMTEVAGDAAFLIDRMPGEEGEKGKWADESARVLQKVILLNVENRQDFISKGLENVKRFNLENTLDELEVLYKEVMSNYRLKN